MAGRVARFSFGTTKAVEPVVVALPATVLLSPGDGLRDDSVGLTRDQRRCGRLGQTGTKGDGRDRYGAARVRLVSSRARARGAQSQPRARLLTAAASRSESFVITSLSSHYIEKYETLNL